MASAVVLWGCTAMPDCWQFAADVPQQSNCSSSARAVAFVAQCIEFHHGSRVEDFQPAIQLTTQLAKPELLAKAAAAAAAAVQAPTDDTQFDASSAVHGDDLDFAAPSLSQQTLRLMQAIVSAHEQVHQADHCPRGLYGCQLTLPAGCTVLALPDTYCLLP